MAQKKSSTAKNKKTAKQESGIKGFSIPVDKIASIGNKLVDFWKAIISRLRRFAWDVLGVILLSVASMSLFALFNLTGGEWLTPWANLLRRSFGWSAYLVLGALAGAGVMMMRRQQEKFTSRHWSRVIAFEIAIFSAAALLAVVGGSSLERADAGLDGGLVGWGLARLIGMVLSPLPNFLSAFIATFFYFFIMVVAGLIGFKQFSNVSHMFGNMLFVRTLPPEEEIASEAAFKHHSAVSVAPEPEPETSKPKTSRRKSPAIPPEFRKQFTVEDQLGDNKIESLPRDDRLPPLDILMTGTEMKPDRRHINQSAGLIEKTLAEFGIPAKVVGFKVGPTITQFAVQPGYLEKSGSDGDDVRQKVRVSQISALKKDLALALSATRLRIQAPVPGRGFIGIEMPNKKSQLVRLRSILETEDFYKLSSPLAFGLGRDVSGQPVVADLAKMPHLLIAGTTGSGKSVCIQALALSLIMNNSPDDLRLVMIDPKMVELVRFNGLPHLYGKVETDLERINGVLRWVVIEMENRYKRLEEIRARDIDSYNKKVQRRKEYDAMPRIVVLIDELADLMMNSADTTETTIVRLAQMARAVGIHLVVATQRPSTDVVTGLIKANFPARLSFNVASGTDSRVILDTSGAESLLGKGDMLYISADGGAPIRAQGVLVSDQEIDGAIRYWQQAWQTGTEPEEEDNAPWEEILERRHVLADRDNLVEDAIEVIRATGSGSASLLQRRLRIGYPRAARLVDELEDMGILGPSKGGGRERDILINLDDDEEEEY